MNKSPARLYVLMSTAILTSFFLLPCSYVGECRIVATCGSVRVCPKPFFSGSQF